MTIFLLLLIFLIISSLEFAPAGQFQREYLSKNSANAVKGIFVILILFSHYTQYVSLGGVYDDAYLILRKHLNQMVVVMFWFYSGFGIMRSVQTKGDSYIHPGLLRRFRKVWLQFAAAVTLFLITGLCLGKQFEWKHLLLSYIGWDSIGNSNWYIFDTLAAYLLLYLSFMALRFVKNRRVREYGGCGIFTVLILLFVWILMAQGRSGYWYNTVFILPVGCWYALLQDRIEKIVMKNDFLYLLCVIANTVIYFISFQGRWEYGIEMYTVWACSFTAMVVLFTMKCAVSSTFLSRFGQHVFSVYILQRIPMMVLDRLGMAQEHKYMFLILSFLLTVLMAMVFDLAAGWKRTKKN